MKRMLGKLMALAVALALAFAMTGIAEAPLGPIVQPEALPEPNPEAIVQPEALPEPDPEAIVQPEALPEPDPEAIVQPETEAEAKPETEPEAQPETEPEAQPETEPEAKPETEAEAQPETEAEAQPETEPEAEPETEPEAKPEIEPETEPETKPAENADSEPYSIRFDEASAPYDGVWVTFDDGFQLYLPSDWYTFEITEEQSESGLFFRAGNNGSDSVVGDAPMGVAVSFVEAGGLTTTEDLKQDFESAGFSNLRLMDLNGIPVVAFDKLDQDYFGASFFHAVYPQYVMTVYVTPLGEAGDAVSYVGASILSSLSPYQPSEE